MADDTPVEIDENDDSQDIEDVDALDPEAEEESEEESTVMTASEDETSWITWFVSIRGNDFFCEVEEAFVQDDFNLTGLSSQVPYYDYALDMILDVDIPVDSLSEEQHEIVETAAEVLYGLIHARYILTVPGMNKMAEKFQNVDFGRCPRSLCQGQPVLPVGLSDITREFSVEVFCPRCHETYHPRSSKHANLDGAYFGTTYAHLFLLTHPELVVLQPTEKYVPRIFGFRIHDTSQYYRLRDPNQPKRKSPKAATTTATTSTTATTGTSTVAAAALAAINSSAAATAAAAAAEGTSAKTRTSNNNNSNSGSNGKMDVSGSQNTSTSANGKHKTSSSSSSNVHSAL